MTNYPQLAYIAPIVMTECPKLAKTFVGNAP